VNARKRNCTALPKTKRAKTEAAAKKENPPKSVIVEYSQ
jgi:hypothetical protein